jgi:hypothetical protein
MKPITTQPTSPPPSISPEVIQMMDTFSKMGVKPKADNSILTFYLAIYKDTSNETLFI